MVRILFVCLGNICRSPMAEYIFRDMAEKRGLGGAKSNADAVAGGRVKGVFGRGGNRRVVFPVLAHQNGDFLDAGLPDGGGVEAHGHAGNGPLLP